LLAAFHSGEDAVGICSPDERFLVGVCVGDEAIDSGFEIVDGSKHARLEAPPCELGPEGEVKPNIHDHKHRFMFM
jgi:hypothetical protein